MIATLQIPTELQLSARVVQTSGELRNLGPDWRDLFRRAHCDNIFLSYEWLSEWWTHLGQKQNLFVVTVRDKGGRLVALAPLCIFLERGPLHIRRLGFLGSTLVGSDHLDFLVDAADLPAALDSLCDFLFRCRSEWDFIGLSDSCVGSVGLTRFQERMKAGGMTACSVRSSLCPYFRLPRSTEEYWANLRPRLRKNLRYHARSLEREGHIEFVTVDGAQEIEGALEDLRRLHEARFAQRNRRSAFLDSKVTEFHRGALRALSAAGRAHIHFLELNGKRIAALYGFSTGTRYFYYQSGADPAFGRFSVGTLLISFAIQAAIRTGHTEFDFLRGDETYKQLWASDTRQLCNASFFDQRSRSRIAQVRQQIQQSLHFCKSGLRRSMGSFFQSPGVTDGQSQTI